MKEAREKCSLCLDKALKHLIVAMGQKVTRWPLLLLSCRERLLCSAFFTFLLCVSCAFVWTCLQCYVRVPPAGEMTLTPLHCQIVPLEHCSNTRSLDDGAFEEIEVCV